VKALDAAARRDDERPVLGDTGRDALDRAPGRHAQAHAAAMVGVMPQPFVPKRAEPLCREDRQRLGQRCEELAEEEVARWRRRAREVGDRLSDRALRVLGHAHIDTDSDHCGRGAERVAGELDEDAAELAVAADEIVGPLQRHLVQAELPEGADAGDTDGERQPAERRGAAVETPQRRERQARPEPRVPARAAPAAAGALELARQRRARRRPGCRARGELAVGRVAFVEELEPETGVAAPETASDRLRVVLNPANLGRGGAVKVGLRLARGRVTGFIDIDLEVSEAYIPRFVQLIEGRADLAVGSRVYKIGLNPFALFRHVVSAGYARLSHAWLGLPVSDSEAGYKFFSVRARETIVAASRFDNWFFDTECVLLAASHGLVLAEYPVLFLRNLTKTSTVRVFRDAAQYLASIRKYRRDVSGGLYGG